MLYAKVALLRLILKCDIELDFDYSRMADYSIHEAFYIENCAHHVGRSFADTSWLRVIPYLDEEWVDGVNVIDLIPSALKSSLNDSKLRSV